MKRLWIAPLALAALIATALPAMAEITPADVDDAREAIRQLASQLEGQVAAYDAAVIEEAQLRDRLDDLVVALAARERDLVLARRAARDRAAEMYMSAGVDDGTTAMVSDEEMGQFPARYVYLASVSQTDLNVVNQLEAARRDFQQQKGMVDEAIDDQEGLRQEMDRLLEVIYTELEVANDGYQEIRAAYDKQEEERILREFLATSTTTTIPPSTTIPVSAPPTPTTTIGSTATTVASATTTVGGTATTAAGGTTTTSATTTTVPPPPPPTASRVCPVDGAVTFRDSWGEPRGGGRTHKGTDMMAARWTPLVAIEAGYIYQVSWHSSGGLGIYVKGVSGAMWYYAHSQAAAEGIRAGTSVVPGQLIGYVGSSGNASTPHLHLGYQPNANWIYANPYPIVNGLCR
ncbi:MAG: peptidoglycan DD-metalloendopeptidase family protein [Acidimicrobiia bacterium]